MNETEIPISSVFGPPQELTDTTLRAHLAAKGLDPHTAPALCVDEVAREYDLPVAVAQGLVSNL